MHITGFLAIFTVGAAGVACWLDWRLEKWRPQSLTWRIGHLAAAFVGLQAATAGSRYLVGPDAPLGQRLGFLFLLVLPSLVYSCLAALWLMRKLADVAGARH